MSLSKTLYPQFSTGSTPEDRSEISLVANLDMILSNMGITNRLAVPT